jgi:hypothetical protein
LKWKNFKNRIFCEIPGITTGTQYEWKTFFKGKLQNNSSLLSNNKLKRREKGRQSGALQQTACPTTEMMLLTKNWNVILKMSNQAYHLPSVLDTSR